MTHLEVSCMWIPNNILYRSWRESSLLQWLLLCPCSTTVPMVSWRLFYQHHPRHSFSHACMLWLSYTFQFCPVSVFLLHRKAIFLIETVKWRGFSKRVWEVMLEPQLLSVPLLLPTMKRKPNRRCCLVRGENHQFVEFQCWFGDKSFVTVCYRWNASYKQKMYW